MEKIYKFLRENKIEDIQELIDYKIGKKKFNNPDNIEVDIKFHNNFSFIHIILKKDNEVLTLHNNSSLHSFLINNMPREELGKLLLITYIEDNNIRSSEHLIHCVYNDCYISAHTVKGMKEDIYLNIEFGKGFKVKRAYFAEGNFNTSTIEINIDDFYNVISTLKD